MGPDGLPAELGVAGQAVAEGVARSLQGLQKLEGEIAELIRQALALALKGGSLAGAEGAAAAGAPFGTVTVMAISGWRAPRPLSTVSMSA